MKTFRVLALIVLASYFIGCAIFGDNKIHYFPTEPQTDTTKVTH